MNVAVMIRAIDQDDGVGVYIRHLIDNLARNYPEHHWFLYYRTEKFLGKYEEYDNCTERLLKWPHKLLWDQLGVPIQAWLDEADVIFNPKFSVPLLTRTPSVMVVHDANWYVYPEQYEPMDLRYIKMMLPVYLRKCPRLLAISNTVVDELENHITFDATKVTTSYAAPAPHFRVINDRDKIDRFRERYALPEQFILGVTRVWHTGLDNPTPYSGKNVETLIKAYQLIREEVGHSLVIAGDRVEEYLLQTGWTRTELQDTEFTGFVAQKDMPLLYNAAEIFALPSYYESFCFPLVEAFSCGCPTVASSGGAVPEVSAGASLLVNPHQPDQWAEALLKVSRNPSLQQKLRDKGLERQSAFSWKRTASLTCGALEAAAGVEENVK